MVNLEKRRTKLKGIFKGAKVKRSRDWSIEDDDDLGVVMATPESTLIQGKVNALPFNVYIENYLHFVLSNRNILLGTLHLTTLLRRWRWIPSSLSFKVLCTWRASRERQR